MRTFTRMFRLSATNKILRTLNYARKVNWPFLYARTSFVEYQSVLWRPHLKVTFTLGGLLSLQPTGDAPSPWLALGVFIGLPTVLWTYKSLMMFIFQRKIVYMGYAPLGARTEVLGQDTRIPKGLYCREVCVTGEKNVKLYGIYVCRKESYPRSPKTILVYLQGNAGNPLSRLPVFERLLSDKPSDTAVLAIAPRSYWKSSSRRATERGLLSDYRHVLQYTMNQYPDSNVILYGHSLGGAIAVCLAAQLNALDHPSIKGLILENPFASIPGMVKALYPERWLPYHYMGPLVFDKWDALQEMQNMHEASLLRRLSENMLVLLSEKDEVVPTEMGRALFEAASDTPTVIPSPKPLMRRGELVVIRGALHEDGWMRRQWVVVMDKYLASN